MSTSSTTTPPSPPVGSLPRRVPAGDATVGRCSVCGAAPRSVRERLDVATDWLVLTDDGQPRPQRFCRGCAPSGSVDDIACVRCGDGPLLAGELTAMTLEASLAVDTWLVGQGWRLAGPVCPECVGELTR